MSFAAPCFREHAIRLERIEENRGPTSVSAIRPPSGAITNQQPAAPAASARLLLEQEVPEPARARRSSSRMRLAFGDVRLLDHEPARPSSDSTPVAFVFAKPYRSFRYRVPSESPTSRGTRFSITGSGIIRLADADRPPSPRNALTPSGDAFTGVNSAPLASPRPRPRDAHARHRTVEAGVFIGRLPGDLALVCAIGGSVALMTLLSGSPGRARPDAAWCGGSTRRSRRETGRRSFQLILFLLCSSRTAGSTLASRPKSYAYLCRLSRARVADHEHDVEVVSST